MALSPSVTCFAAASSAFLFDRNPDANFSVDSSRVTSVFSFALSASLLIDCRLICWATAGVAASTNNIRINLRIFIPPSNYFRTAIRSSAARPRRRVPELRAAWNLSLAKQASPVPSLSHLRCGEDSRDRRTVRSSGQEPQPPLQLSIASGRTVSAAEGLSRESGQALFRQTRPAVAGAVLHREGCHLTASLLSSFQ